MHLILHKGWKSAASQGASDILDTSAFANENLLFQKLSNILYMCLGIADTTVHTKVGWLTYVVQAEKKGLLSYALPGLTMNPNHSVKVALELASSIKQGAIEFIKQLIKCIEGKQGSRPSEAYCTATWSQCQNDFHVFFLRFEGYHQVPLIVDPDIATVHLA